jgi:hypothetical protein
VWPLLQSLLCPLFEKGFLFVRHWSSAPRMLHQKSSLC